MISFIAATPGSMPERYPHLTRRIIMIIKRSLNRSTQCRSPPKTANGVVPRHEWKAHNDTVTLRSNARTPKHCVGMTPKWCAERCLVCMVCFGDWQCVGVVYSFVKWNNAPCDVLWYRRVTCGPLTNGHHTHANKLLRSVQWRKMLSNKLTWFALYMITGFTWLGLRDFEFSKLHD